MKRFLSQLLQIVGASLLVYFLSAGLLLLTLWVLTRLGVDWQHITPVYIIAPCALPALLGCAVLFARIRDTDLPEGEG